MKTLALSLCLLAASAALSAPASADSRLDNFKLQMATSEMNNAENAAKIKKAFKLAAAERGRQAIEISCSPASSSWCAKDFVTACDNAKGGLSTNPDGGVTCSLPQYK